MEFRFWSGVRVLSTSMVPSRSAGSASKPTFRSSPAPDICAPFIFIDTKPGPKPRTVTNLPSPSERCSVTPGNLRRDSATFWSTKLPKSSVEITELKPFFMRSKSRAFRSACLTPFTSTTSISLGVSFVSVCSVFSWAGAVLCAMLENAVDTARARAVHWNTFMFWTPKFQNRHSCSICILLCHRWQYWSCQIGMH